MANIERARADHLRSTGALADSLERYGRSIFYELATHINANARDAADKCTQASYREFCWRAAKVLAEPLLPDRERSAEDRLAEARRHAQSPVVGLLITAAELHIRADLGVVDAAEENLEPERASTKASSAKDRRAAG